MTVLKIFFHDACFDGTASAALFGAFYRARTADVRLAPVGMQHRLGDPFSDVAIDGDDNACVDFRYVAHPALRWWFDHHPTAFQPPSLRADFDARVGDQMVFDPSAPSCCGLIARSLTARFGWTPPAHLSELVRWADIIDAAAYPSATEACRIDAPAQRLALWLSENRDPAATARYIEALTTTPLAELAEAPWIRPVLTGALAHREAHRAGWRALARSLGDVVVFDLLATDLPPPGFSGYELFPDCTYTVTLARSPTAMKIGVGHNPWGGGERRHDLGALCEAHGGGGHAAVGGVTLPPDAIDHARAVSAAMIRVLSQQA